MFRRLITIAIFGACMYGCSTGARNLETSYSSDTAVSKANQTVSARVSEQQAIAVAKSAAKAYMNPSRQYTISASWSEEAEVKNHYEGGVWIVGICPTGRVTLGSGVVIVVDCQGNVRSIAEGL
jgi:hypothetical protein